ncbi:MAG: uroporphyrinogen decarboxylase family protein [Anaerolineae bacterium]
MAPSLTARERLVHTLCCQTTDRAPLPDWMGLAPWGETLRRWRCESGLADLDVGAYFGLDPNFRVAPVAYGPWPHFPAEVLSENDEFVFSRDFRGITVRNRRDLGSMPEWIRHPIATPEDWAQYKADRLSGPVEERLADLDAWAEQARADDAPVQVGVFPWGVFGTARDMLGAEEVLLGFYTQPDLLRDIMETYTTLWLALYEQVAQRVPIDHVHIWEDMSGKQGSLISMRMVEEFMMPQYDRIVAFARAHGVPVVSVDTDGVVDQLLPVMMRHGINAMMPFEAQAGNDLVAMRNAYPGLGMWGGLNKASLAKDRAAIHAELDRAEQMLALGGWVPGFDHLIPPDVPWGAFCGFVNELKRMVGL